MNAELKEIDEGFLSVAKRAAKLAEQSREVKVYVDYLGYLIEKADADGTLYATMETFVMEAFVPTEKVEEVKAAIEKATRACEIETKVVPRDEFAPTLMKNKSAVANFEAVTNMYSVPAYGALDPNAVMSFFFSLPRRYRRLPSSGMGAKPPRRHCSLKSTLCKSSRSPETRSKPPHMSGT